MKIHAWYFARRIGAFTLIASTGLALVGASTPMRPESVVPLPAAAVRVLPTEQQQAAQQTASYEAVVTQAQAVLAASDGQVLHQSVRAQLASDLASVTRLEQDARFAIPLGVAPDGEIPALRTLASAVSQIVLDSATVTTDVAAEKAHRVAVAAAAARARAAAAARSTGGSTGPHGFYVWTSGQQAAINACRGLVDVTSWYGAGVRVVAEHWSCGGSAFPKTAGRTVVLTGLDAGTYVVKGIVSRYSASTGSTAIPSGYSLLFQTCDYGDTHKTVIVGLQRVG